jgi:hypothetical protein
MSALVNLRGGESSLFRASGYRVQDNTIVSEGLIHVTTHRLLFYPATGLSVVIERSHIECITRVRFGFLPAWSVQADDDTEVSLIVRDGWLLEQALGSLSSGGRPVQAAAARAGFAPTRSRSRRALHILALAIAAAFKALLADLGLRRFR